MNSKELSNSTNRACESVEIRNLPPDLREGFKKLLRPWPHVYLEQRMELLLRQAQEMEWRQRNGKLA